MQNKIKTYIGFAIKAKQAVFGADAILETKQTIYVCIVDENLPTKTKQKLISKLSNGNACVWQASASAIQEILQKQNVKAFGVCNAFLAQAMIEENKISKQFAEVQ